jgi:lipoate-protein ligase A
MQFLDLTLPTLAENLALDEALLLAGEAGRGGEVLRLWEWPAPAVVLGSGCPLAEDVIELACLADGVPVSRRASGGGTVLLGAGCLLYTLVLAYDRSPLLREIRWSYRYILGHIRNSLADVIPGIEMAGTSDLAAAGLKFSGNAQQRKRSYLLHHGTLLYDFEIDQVSRYLYVPARQPAYRGGRAHSAFLRNLPIQPADLRRRLREGWKTGAVLARRPEELVAHLAADKYGKAEWVRRR